LPRLVVDGGADARAPHRERLQPQRRGPPRQRHTVRSAADARRVAPGAHRRRPAADRARRGRDPHLPRGRRSGHAAGLVRTARLRAHRVRRGRGHGAAGLMRSAPLKSYRYYDLILGAYVCVLLCANLIGPAKVSTVPVPLWGPVTFMAGVLFFPISSVFGDILTEVYGYARARRGGWGRFAELLVGAFMPAGFRVLAP